MIDDNKGSCEASKRLVEVDREILEVDREILDRDRTILEHDRKILEHDREILEIEEEEAGRRPRRLVTVTINGRKEQIFRGVYKVSALKEALHVPQDEELEIIEHGELKPLPDNSIYRVKGGEVFVSHIRQGGSS